MKSIARLLLSAAGLLLAVQAHAANPIVIKFSHVVAENTPKGRAALKFKALAEERTQGRVKVDVYPNSQLYKDKEELEALQLGALLQTMAFSEVYQALQTGVVDGTEGPVSNLFTQKHYEVQKYVVDTDHTYSGYAVVVNKKFWDSLPADIRTILEGAMKEATECNNAMSDRDTVDAWKAVKAAGKTEVYKLTPAEKEAWIKAMSPVQDEMAGRVGKDLLAAIRKEVAGMPPK